MWDEKCESWATIVRLKMDVFVFKDVRAIIETNLWLRAADRIKIIVGTVPAKTCEELFQGVFALDWENYLPLGARFPISKAKCVKSKLHNEPSVQAISKKAVVKKLQRHYARPEGVPLSLIHI